MNNTNTIGNSITGTAAWIKVPNGVKSTVDNTIAFVNAVTWYKTDADTVFFARIGAGLLTGAAGSAIMTILTSGNIPQ